MCPEKELLSAYYDNELEAPWKEKIRNHLKICEKCRQKMEDFKQLSLFLQSDPEPFTADAIDTVREKIYHHKYSRQPHHIWERKISLPMPVFAVAAALLIAIGAIFVFRMTAPNPTQTQITVSKDPSGGTQVQVSTSYSPEEMETLLKQLKGHDLFEEDSFEEAKFELPPENQVWTFSEPKLMREVDYKRNSE